MSKKNVHFTPESTFLLEEWRLGDEEILNENRLRSRASLDQKVSVTPAEGRSSSRLLFFYALGLAILLHAGALFVHFTKAPVVAPLSDSQLTLIEVTPTDGPAPSSPERSNNTELHLLQDFHTAAVERSATLEKTLGEALARQTAQETAYQQQMSTLEAAQTNLSGQLETLTIEQAELSAQLATERQRTSEFQKQLQEQARAKESEISGVKGAYDRLVAALQAEISQKEIALRQSTERLTVTITDRVLFPTGQAALTAEGRRIVEKIGAILVKVPDRHILIEGHTDNVPIGESLKSVFPSNWELSAARATEVVRYLIAQTKLPPNRLSASGRADTMPVANNANEEGRAQNRRIEIILLPPENQPHRLS
jgi:chemotaxis protein MotB